MALDGYEEFFNKFKISHEEFIEFGLASVISIDLKEAISDWQDLKRELFNNRSVTIRGYGRDALGTPLYLNLYKKLFSNSNIAKDQTNNNYPTLKIEKLTGYKKNGKGENSIVNYQVSHVFGRTKNPLAFTAPWNIVFIPKVFDPFTGHESKGDLTDEFTKRLKLMISKKYLKLIVEFNQIMKKKVEASVLDKYLDEVLKAGEYGEKANK